MEELAGNLGLIGQYGIATLLFFVFYLYHKATCKQQEKTMEQQALQAKENFELLKDMISTNILQNALLTRIDEKITHNQWCPYVKNFLNEGGRRKNESTNNANEN